MGMDTSVRIARSMTRGWKGRGPRGAIGDTDSRSTSGPDPAAGDIRIVTPDQSKDSICLWYVHSQTGEGKLLTCDYITTWSQ